MGVIISQRLPYNEFFGGVSGLTVKQFKQVNGFPNAFWGWGGEDDDLWNRWGKQTHTHTHRQTVILSNGCGFCHRHLGSGWCVATSEQANIKGFSRLDSGSSPDWVAKMRSPQLEFCKFSGCCVTLRYCWHEVDVTQSTWHPGFFNSFVFFN